MYIPITPPLNAHVTPYHSPLLKRRSWLSQVAPSSLHYLILAVAGCIQYMRILTELVIINLIAVHSVFDVLEYKTHKNKNTGC